MIRRPRGLCFERFDELADFGFVVIGEVLFLALSINVKEIDHISGS